MNISYLIFLILLFILVFEKKKRLVVKGNKDIKLILENHIGENCCFSSSNNSFFISKIEGEIINISENAVEIKVFKKNESIIKIINIDYIDNIKFV